MLSLTHSLSHSRRSTISTPLKALLKSTSSSSPSSSTAVQQHVFVLERESHSIMRVEEMTTLTDSMSKQIHIIMTEEAAQTS